MGTAQSNVTGPDLAQGIPVDDLPDGHMLAGHVGEEAVLLARRGDEYFAIGAICSHCGGPLAEGLMVDDTVRCPWHHACFSLRSGQPLRPPALSPVACWSVEQRGGKVFVQNKRETPESKKKGSLVPGAGSTEKVVIVGGGAAGFAARPVEFIPGERGHDDARADCVHPRAALAPANRLGRHAERVSAL